MKTIDFQIQEHIYISGYRVSSRLLPLGSLHFRLFLFSEFSLVQVIFYFIMPTYPWITISSGAVVTLCGHCSRNAQFGHCSIKVEGPPQIVGSDQESVQKSYQVEK